MKIRQKIICVIAVLAMFLQSSFALDIVTQDVGAIPAEASAYIKENFASAKIMSIKIEKELLGIKEYEVLLTDGTEIEFNPSGEWKQVENKIAFVPMKLLEAPISAYLKQNYPDRKVVSLKKKEKGFEVELDTRLELVFTKDGKFLGIDD